MWQGQDSNLCRQCRRFYRSQRRFLAGPVLSLPGPDHRCDVHKRPVDSFRRPSASPPASPYPERPSVGRREVGGKSRPRAGRQCGPRLRGWAPSLPSGRPATYSPSPRAHSALAGPPTALRCAPGTRCHSAQLGRWHLRSVSGNEPGSGVSSPAASPAILGQLLSARLSGGPCWRSRPRGRVTLIMHACCGMAVHLRVEAAAFGRWGVRLPTRRVHQGSGDRVTRPAGGPCWANRRPCPVRV